MTRINYSLTVRWPMNQSGTKSGFAPRCVTNRMEPNGSNTIPQKLLCYTFTITSFILVDREKVSCLCFLDLLAAGSTTGRDVVLTRHSIILVFATVCSPLVQVETIVSFFTCRARLHFFLRPFFMFFIHSTLQYSPGISCVFLVLIACIVRECGSLLHTE